MASQVGVSKPLQMDQSGLRQAMGRFATGVTVVTTRLGEELHGMTANAVTSVSLQPLLALVCVDKAAHLHDALRRSGIFGLSVLAREQEPLARRFSDDARAHDTSDFGGVGVFEVATGAPLIAGCLSYVDCRVVEAIEGGDHTIFLGEVQALGVAEHGAPLLFYAGRYTGLAEG